MNEDKIFKVLKELRNAIICLRDEVEKNGIDIYTTPLNIHLTRANELMGIWKEE